MSLLSCPDVNVWLALLRADHIHRDAATAWWTQDQSDELLFCRFTQLGVLRLLTTAAAMNNRPLSMRTAWAAYDCLFQDQRVVLVPEPPGLDAVFRKIAVSDVASRKGLGRRISPRLREPDRQQAGDLRQGSRRPLGPPPFFLARKL